MTARGLPNGLTDTTETTMSDNKQATAQDRKLISLKEEYEVRDWMKSFGCAREELERAVSEVGHSAEAVRAYLQAKR